MSSQTWSQSRLSVLAAAAAFAASLLFIPDPLTARVGALVCAALVLWLWEALPSFVPTLFLWAGIPLLLGPFAAEYRLGQVLTWAADPVLALFLGAFILARAAHVSGLDQYFMDFLLRAAGPSRLKLSLAICGGTAFLSMWMSNVAAAALMLATMRPLLQQLEPDERRRFLLSLALGANIGGMITPLGSGPNAIALAQLQAMNSPLGFVSWIAIALPLALLLLALGLLWLHRLDQGREMSEAIDLGRLPAPEGGEKRVLVLWVAALAIVAWLTESWHGVPAAVVAMSAGALLFLTGTLKKNDLAHVDGASLLLIAGGITLGRLLETSGIFNAAAESNLWTDLATPLRYALLLSTAAILSALMSNTATATLLVPLAAHALPGAEAPVLIAIACSLGMPFSISTPPNAIVASEGSVKNKDLLLLGGPLMVFGLLWIVLSGPGFLRWVLS